ncbi:MAG: CotH kinase family protein [Clostridia bacterium]|nr:CotH kinase family protein [Clostridia bacterium]
MLRTKQADRIVCIATVVMLLASVCLWGIVEPARGDGSHTVGYESLLFDQSKVHTIDITMDGWDAFIQNATAEEYVDCNVVVDGEQYNHVAIRAKGNTSLSSVATLGSTRYSFKLEFDHFVEGMTYHGLDKLSLNNLIQDATMMKDYLAYTLMNRMGVPASLCSYVQINVNGEPWGLYLAVEGVEDAFGDRNGMTKGELYKPDSLSFGGGRGNGRDFDIEQFRVKDDEEESDTEATPETSATAAPETNSGNPFGNFPGGMMGDQSGMPQRPQGNFNPFGGDGQMPQMPSGDFSSFTPQEGMGSFPSESTESADGETSGSERRGRRDFGGGGGFGGFNFGMGSDDVKLVYTDDDPDSYSNIFNNAKTDVSSKDKTRLIESLKKLNEKEDLDSVVDKDEVIRYLAVHNFLCNDDSYTGMMVHNYYLYEEKGKLSIIPWDYNLGFGGFSAGSNATSTVNSPIDNPVSSGTTDSRPLIAWIFSDEEALAAYHEAYNTFITENIESGWLAEEISRVQEMITPYLEKDESAFYDMEAFEKAVDTLQTFCAKRGESIRGQLDGTIPSTSAEQRSSDALIDASEISTADMGSMGGSGGGFGGGNGGGGFGGGMPGGMPSGMPSEMPDFSGGSFTPPDGMNMEGFSMPSDFSSMFGQGGQNPFGGGSQPAAPDAVQDQTAAPTEQSTSQPADQANADAVSADAPLSTDTAKPQSGERSSRPSGGFPGGGDFPGMQQTDHTAQWIQVAACAALLLVALLLMRKAGSHNS